MEYELYSYCTGMGCLVIFLIVFYHFLGDGEHKHQQQEATNWYSYGFIFKYLSPEGRVMPPPTWVDIMSGLFSILN